MQTIPQSPLFPEKLCLWVQQWSLWSAGQPAYLTGIAVPVCTHRQAHAAVGKILKGREISRSYLPLNSFSYKQKETFARCINFQFIKPPVFSINRLIVICSNEPEFICLLTDSGHFQRCFPYHTHQVNPCSISAHSHVTGLRHPLGLLEYTKHTLHEASRA